MIILTLNYNFGPEHLVPKLKAPNRFYLFNLCLINSCH